MVSNATPIFATVRKKTLDGCHMAEVRTPSLATAFQVVARDPPPLTILAPGFPWDNQLSVPLAPDVAETVDCVGVKHGPNGHEVSMPPPCAPSLATDRVDRREGGSRNKKEAKLKKRNDREWFLVRISFWIVLGK